MVDFNSIQKRKSKWNTSYSKMSVREAEKRLGFRLEELTTILVSQMLAGAGHSLQWADAIKARVYNRIVEYIAFVGFPTEARTDYKEANVSDLVLCHWPGTVGFRVQDGT